MLAACSQSRCEWWSSEREIEQFVKTELDHRRESEPKLPPAFDSRLFKIGEQTVKTSGFDQDLKKNEILINEQAKADAIVAEAQQQSFVVNDVTTKERKRNPVPPFIIETATGSFAQTRFRSEEDDDAGAEALRRCRAW